MALEIRLASTTSQYVMYGSVLLRLLYCLVFITHLTTSSFLLGHHGNSSRIGLDRHVMSTTLRSSRTVHPDGFASRARITLREHGVSFRCDGMVDVGNYEPNKQQAFSMAVSSMAGLSLLRIGTAAIPSRSRNSSIHHRSTRKLPAIN